MNLAALAIEKRTVTYFAVCLIIVAGIASFFQLGQLEDPEFTVKTAIVTTAYPGASQEEVELEVTDRIEIALQEMPQLDFLESISRAGLSIIRVNIKPIYWADRLPQIWDELRRKIRDIEETLPPGAERPEVSDDFGDVFGFVLAVTGDGYSDADLEYHVKALQRELSLVEGVARVDLWGVQEKVIYVDVAQTQLAELGLTDENIAATLSEQNLVVDAGHVDVREKRFRISPTGAFETPEDIGNLFIAPSVGETAGAPAAGARSSSELIQVRDVATVRRGYREPPRTLMRFNGQPALGISLTNISGANVVELGRAVDARLNELLEELPVGIDVHRVAWQSDVVAKAVNSFLVNLAEAIGIVLVVLTVAMGWRMGVIIGGALVLTILGTFILMALFGIDLQRMSLGALVIALGMMVDNAIVVADGVHARLQRGMERRKAAIEAASQPAWPLLGATVVAVMAFYPIFASTESAGEFSRTLFAVVAISLLASWVISMTVTPMQCIDLLPKSKNADEETDPYAGRLYQRFRRILERAIRWRWLTLGSMVALLVIAIIGFGNVKQLFFPDSQMPKLMVDYWAPEGTRIQQVAADLSELEKKLREDPRVEAVSAFIGQGPPRFYLPVDPELPNQSFAQIIVNLHDFRDVNALIADFEPWTEENVPQSLVRVRKYGVGPSDTWKFETRISGPAQADPAILRGLAEQGRAILEASPLAKDVRTDWRQRVQKLVPEYSQERGRWATISREQLAQTTKRAYDGRVVGQYREKEDLFPIVIRHVEDERQNVSGLDALQIQSAFSTETVPLSQVIQTTRMEWEDPIIWRRDRRRTITVQASPNGVTLPMLRANVLADFDAIELPPGYQLEWGGEYESTVDSQASLIPGIIPTVAIMLFIIVALFNAFRPPLIIILTIPFAVIGISAGLLGTGTPFGFMALLGAMSLAGMMIKNAIVLLDEVNVNLAAGKSPYQAVVDSAVSRLRPVVLAAATTVLGVIPLLQDVFWVGMAVTIMSGLAFGTILTMVAVPVLYAALYRIRLPQT